MSDTPAGFVRTELPARLADLACTFLRPKDWKLADLPNEDTDFSSPQTFAPLAIAMAPFAAIVFSIGARPAFEDGTLADWLGYLAREQGYDPGAIEQETDLPQPAVGCWAMQTSDGTVLRMRLLLLEDGKRLVCASVLAPDALWLSVHDTLRTMLRSFTLVRPQGATVALAAPGTELPESTYTARPLQPAPEAPRPRQPDVEVVTYAEYPEALPVEEFQDEGPTQFATVALAFDSATLRQDHPINQNLLQRGAGFVGKILAEYPDLRCATVTAPALQGTLRIPYGWHLLDDSRRSLVHDGQGGVQIDLSRRDRQGKDADGFLQLLFAEVQKQSPNLDRKRLRINGTECLMILGMVVEGEPLAQVFMLRHAPKDELLVARITCKPDDLTRAGNCAELLLRDAVFLDAPGAEPVWWTEAQRLEQAGHIEAAEQLLRQSIDHLGCYSQIAHLHELRGHRLAEAGDHDGAKAAYEASGEWMDAMAGGATSGGEGAALSLQRDQHRARLGLQPYGT